MFSFSLSLSLSPFQRYRLIAIPILAWLLLHFLFYQKLPLQKGYQFPWELFFIIILMGLFICQCNFLVYHWLRGKKPQARKINIQGVIYHYAAGGLATWMMYSLLYLIQLWYFQSPFDIVRYVGFGLLMLGISGLETSVLLLRDMYGFLQKKPKKGIGIPILEQKDKNYGLLNIPSGKQIIRLPMQEVAFVYSSSGIISIHTISGKKITSNFSALDELQPLLPEAPFFRLNRQYLVHRQAIGAIAEAKNRKLEVSIHLQKPADEPLIITVSRYKASAFKQWFAHGNA